MSLYKLLKGNIDYHDVDLTRIRDEMDRSREERRIAKATSFWLTAPQAGWLPATQVEWKMGIRSRMYFANETSCIEKASRTNEVTNDSTPMYLAFPVEHVKTIRLYVSKLFLELHTGCSVNLPHKFLHGQIMLL